MEGISKKLVFWFQVISVTAASLLLAVLIVSANWSEPEASPPEGNVEPPLNTSSDGQVKKGGLLLGNDPTVTNGLLVEHGNVGIGTTDLGKINTNPSYQWGLAPSDKRLVISTSSGSVLNLESTLPLDAANVGKRLGAIVFSNTSGQSDAHRQLTGIVSRITGTAGSPIYTYQADLGFFTKGAGAAREVMTITSVGRVGIGTTTPQARLYIASGPGFEMGFDNAAEIGARNSSGTMEGFLWPRWANNMTYLNFGSGGFNIRNSSSVSRVFIDQNGNVGIGTTGPGAPLHVRRDQAGSYTYVIVDNNGTVQSGTGAGFGIAEGGSIKGGLRFERNFSGQFTFFSNSNGPWVFMRSDGGGEAMRITNTGNVGIGTMGPVAKLHVVGDANFATSSEVASYEYRNAGPSSGTSPRCVCDSDSTDLNCPDSFPATAADPLVCYDVYFDEQTPGPDSFKYNKINNPIRTGGDVSAADDLTVGGELVADFNSWGTPTGYDYRAGNSDPNAVSRGKAQCPQGYYVVGIEILDADFGQYCIDCINAIKVKCAKL